MNCALHIAVVSLSLTLSLSLSPFCFERLPTFGFGCQSLFAREAYVAFGMKYLTMFYYKLYSLTNTEQKITNPPSAPASAAEKIALASRCIREGYV